MQETQQHRNILFDKMSVELECTARCDLGVGGAKYKTPALEFDNALQMLDRHRADCHEGRGGRSGEAATEGWGEVLVRPSLSRGCSQREFEHFKLAWTVYVLVTDEEDDELMSNRLFSSLEKELKMTLVHTLGDRSGTISIVDMLEEIGQRAVQGKYKNRRGWTPTGLWSPRGSS